MKIKNVGSFVTWIIVSATIIAAVIYLLVISVFGISENRHYDFSVIKLNSSWIDQTGKSCNLSALPNGENILTANVSGIKLDNMRLCTKSVDTNFSVWADGECIYSYEYVQSDLTGCSYGMNMHMIPIPADAKELGLRLVPIFPEKPPLLMDTVISDPGMYLGDFFSNGLPNFCICVLILVIGLSTLTLGLCGIMRIEFISLGLFACFTALWSVNETMFLQIITQKPEIVRALSYITFAAIPFPPVAFISKLTDSKNRIPQIVMASLVFINMVGSIVLSTLNLIDFHYSVHVTRILIVLAMVMCVVMTTIAIKNKTINKRLLITLTAGVAVAVFGTVIDLIRYLFTESVVQGVGTFTRIGIFGFLLVFIGYIVTDYSRVRIESEKAEVMSRLAHTDALTGLNNRLAFNKMESTLKSDKKNDTCVIVQLDVNNLKVVNDVYGHSEGDKHIRAAAEIIQKSFGDFGDCYRTGGDEFVTVLSPCGDTEGAVRAVEKMIQLEEEYNNRENPPVKLQIAYGFALCKNNAKELELTELLADQRMYDCKKKMKSEAAQQN